MPSLIYKDSQSHHSTTQTVFAKLVSFAMFYYKWVHSENVVGQKAQWGLLMTDTAIGSIVSCISTSFIRFTLLKQTNMATYIST